MEEFVTIIQDFGIYGALMILILVLGFKYIPKFLELKLKHYEEKNYMIDTMKSVIENNSQVVNNNSEVIKLNSITIKNYTDNAHKLENNFNSLTNEVKETNKLIEKMSTNVEILKERSK